ncbi:hypothetical protein JAAARDRAFT_522497 [Jaapia argillacea MUCL 33604]|uniref:Mitochondrial carrier n=1 Tax=Jaapia argillacea MUCL 33604 TaxID=933084 RepID=A0A067Q406_9AGAM|nr:hypothetical protein JAAARDRAFT_522497 [Jaapia argillacea MUCL 33604]
MGSNGENAPGLDPTVDFIAGTVSGMAALCVGYPFDTVKVRFQNPETSAKYRTTFGAVGTIIREERFVGLYKGIGSPLAGCAFLNGLIFASYRFFMKVQLKSEKDVPTLAQVGLAGAGSGIVSSVITTPMELIKIHQQNALHSSASARAAAVEIFKQFGIRGLYRGITVTALRDIGYGAYFASYEATCRLLSHTPSSSASDHSSLISEAESELGTLSWPALLVAGGVAGVTGWLATFPLDVVKTRVQSTFPTSSKDPYRNTLSTIIHSYRAEGLGVFFRGLAPTLIRAIPVNMVTFATFEGVVHALS